MKRELHTVKMNLTKAQKLEIYESLPKSLLWDWKTNTQELRPHRLMFAFFLVSTKGNPVLTTELRGLLEYESERALFGDIPALDYANYKEDTNIFTTEDLLK